nr:IS66 family insertion sequence element accessory protein TnpB [Vibrio splendidus]
MAKRRTNLEWQSLFEQYESSSVTQRAFCEEHGLSLSTFFAKRRQLQTVNQSESVGFSARRIRSTLQPKGELKWQNDAPT